MVNIKFVVPEEWTVNQKGEFFEKEIGKLLSKMRYDIKERIRFTGMEIDVLAKHKDTGQIAFAECKFQKDNITSDIITDLIGKAFLKDADIAFLFSVSDLGREAKGVLEELHSKTTRRGPIFSFIDPETIGQMYLDVSGVNPIEYKLKEHNLSEKHIGNITLTISPNQDFWVIEYKNDGIPSYLLLMPFRNSEFVDIAGIRRLLDENKLWLGLECKNGVDWLYNNDFSIPKLECNEIRSNNVTQSETISQIPQADQFDDYRPCRPEDFVGRGQLQKDIWDFLEKVRIDETKTRIISLVGQSGFGKSSLILKLSNRFRNPHWNKKFYIFHVDTRSANSPLFLAQAILKGFNKAQTDDFIKIKESLSLDSIDSPLNSRSIQNALSYLKKNNKVLIIFFDQFEELFLKEELQFLFDNFKELSFEVDELQENLVLGFSWRTGLSLPQEHPAYHLWIELRERRKEFTIGKFDSSEISQQLQLLAKYIDVPLEAQLKRRLKEQCLGLPWLLKKLCIHIHRQIKKGVKQGELIASQFNVQQLFEEDLVGLVNDEPTCLKYTAMNSPVEIVELSEKYGWSTINSLYSRRLIIRTGHKYAIYWDIFRDYLINGKLPVIPLTVVPTSNVPTILRAIQLFDKHDSLNKDEIAARLSVTSKTVQNIIGDLSIFMIIRKSPEDDGYLITSASYQMF